MRIKRVNRHDYRVSVKDATSGHTQVIGFTVTDQVYGWWGSRYEPLGRVEGTVHDTLRRIARSHGFC